MLIFFIHGVNTDSYRYADTLIFKIKRNIHEKHNLNFYSSFWGDLFNHKKHQTIKCLEKDYQRACRKHPEYKAHHHDIYRYKRHRNNLVNNFLGDFLNYQNSARGVKIRAKICQQLSDVLDSYPNEQEIHLIAHSLGTIILWDLLFEADLAPDDPVWKLREKFESRYLASVTTMGSPLLLFQQMNGMDFSAVAKSHFCSRTEGQQKFRWVNIIHSSDMLAYPLKASVEEMLQDRILFYDQFLWVEANGAETNLRMIGQADLAMVVAAKDAHGAYFSRNKNGDKTAQIIAQTLLGEMKTLSKRAVTFG